MKTDSVSEQLKSITLEQLQALGRKRGYNPMWAHMVYNARERKRQAQAKRIKRIMVAMQNV
jgi:hypothetical protein